MGVIIGDDFVIRDGRAVTDARERAGQDRSVHGYKKLLREEPEHARALADQIIKNTYRTLMTRGQKAATSMPRIPKPVNTSRLSFKRKH